jgi:glutamate racemase
MDRHSVCFLDSGVGGLPYLGAAREYLQKTGTDDW